MYLALFLFLYSVSFLNAQEVKKSTKVEKVGDTKYYLHTVEAGQTLSSIAKAYYLDVNDIIIENPAAIDGLKPGEELKIPYLKSLKNGYEKNKSGKNKGTTHKTEAGQTLYSIAKLYGVTVDELRTANPELKDGLKAGQVLRIPVPAKPPEGGEKIASDSKATEKKGDDPVKVEKITPREESKPKVTESERVTDLVMPGDTVFSLVKLEKYKVGLFAPFHGENVDNIETDRFIRDQVPFPAKPELAVQFYEGFRLAMDSLRKTGLHIELFIYDIDDNDSAKIQDILKKPELKDLNLIIGPFAGSVFLPVSKFAHQHSIPIVSPLSQQNKILLNNEYVSKMTPSITTQLEEEAGFVARNYVGQNVVLVSNSNSKEIQYVSIFRTRLNEILKASGSSDSIFNVKAAEGVGKALSLTKVNVVVIPSNSQAYVTDILRTLNTLSDKYQIVVFGMQSWSGFTNLDYDYLENLKLHYPVNAFVEYDNENTLNFIKNFRIYSGCEPGVYAFEGYDAGVFYLSTLRDYGVNFRKKLSKIKWTGTQGSFDLYKTSPESGYENKAVNLVMIQDFKLVRASK